MNYMEREKAAAEQVKALVALPLIGEHGMRTGCDDEFDPWRLFDSLYGSYSEAFDDMAIEVLERLIAPAHGEESLAHEMFREMLCTASLCDYGMSPRSCWPTPEFREHLPALIAKWREYRALVWADSEEG